MPTYEYRCDTCDTTFDVVQSFHDDPLTECPTCGSPVRKVFGSVGIVFKGSGFYKTDSRSGGSSKSGESTVPATKSDSSSSDSGSSTSSDSGSSGSTATATSSGSKDAGSSGSAGSGSSGSTGSGSSGSSGSKGSGSKGSGSKGSSAAG